MKDSDMKGWILCDFNNKEQNVEVQKDRQLYNLTDDRIALMKEKYGVEFINVYDVQVEIGISDDDLICVGGELMNKPDFVFALFVNLVHGNANQSHHMRVLQYLEDKGVFCFQTASVMSVSSNKLLTTELLHKAGIPVPKTIYLSEHTPVGWIVEQLSFPMVVKPVDGSCGNGVCLVHSEKELKNIVELYCQQGRELLAQEYIATSKGRDWRITLCGDNQVIVSGIRDNSAGDDFRSNLHQGGHYILQKPSPEAFDIATRAFNALNMNIGGIDLLFAPDGKFVVGEVNSMPGGRADLVYEGEKVGERYFRILLETAMKRVMKQK